LVEHEPRPWEPLRPKVPFLPGRAARQGCRFVAGGPGRGRPGALDDPVPAIGTGRRAGVGWCGVTSGRLLVVVRTRPGPGCKPCATDPAAGIARRWGGWRSRRSGRQRSTRRRWRPFGWRCVGDAIGVADPGWTWAFLGGDDMINGVPDEASSLAGASRGIYGMDLIRGRHRRGGGRQAARDRGRG
jgi:hypothetical protein